MNGNTRGLCSVMVVLLAWAMPAFAGGFHDLAIRDISVTRDGEWVEMDVVYSIALNHSDPLVAPTASGGHVAIEVTLYDEQGNELAAQTAHLSRVRACVEESCSDNACGKGCVKTTCATCAQAPWAPDDPVRLLGACAMMPVYPCQINADGSIERKCSICRDSVATARFKFFMDLWKKAKAEIGSTDLGEDDLSNNSLSMENDG